MPTIAESVATLISREGCNGEVNSEDPSVVSAVEQITALAYAYTRGRGFDDVRDDIGELGRVPNPDIRAAIVTAAGRLAANPGQIPMKQETGRSEKTFTGAFTGWSTTELFALNRYRVRAM